MKFSEIITYTQSSRFQSHTSLQWLLIPLLLFVGLSYLSKRAKLMLKDNKDPINVLKASLLVIVPIASYFIGWPLVTKYFNSFGNNMALILSLIISVSIIILIILSTRFKLFSEVELDESLKRSPHVLVLAGFFIFYVIFTPLKIAPLENQIGDRSVFPRDPLLIQGNSYMVSHDLIKKIRQSVPEDAVILAGPQTSEVLTTFVPRFVVTYQGGHQSPTQVGADSREHMLSTVSFFDKTSDNDKRLMFIKDNGIDYILVNRRNHARFQLQSEDVLEKTLIVYDDGNFSLYKVTDLK